MALHLVTAPAAGSLPVTLEAAKRAIRREDVEDDDEHLQDEIIPAASDRCEGATGRQLLTATWDLKLDEFPACGWIEIPKPPLDEVLSISYVDQDGTTQTWDASNYRVSAPAGPKCGRGRIEPAYGVSWPTARQVIDAVTVRFVAGYGTGHQHVPALLRSAMLMDIATLFLHRENMVAGTIVAEVPHRAGQIYWSFRSHPQTR